MSINISREDNLLELLTLEEVANLLKVTKKTIYRLVERNAIPAIRVGRRWRFSKAEIDLWLKQRSSVAVASILVIDDDQTVCSLFKDILESEGHKVKTTTRSSEGLELIKTQDFDLVFLDLMMPEIDGAEIFKQIRSLKPRLPVTIITGYPESELMKTAISCGPFGVMNKPFREADVLIAVNSYLHFGA